MNNYKFGNYICKLREELNMTQAELAKELNLSDKAISKWENGQAFPRIDTFEKLASVLNTTIEDIFSASKDGITRVCLINNFFSIMQLDINGQLYALRNDESKWVEISSDSIEIKISGDLVTDSDFSNSSANANAFKEKIMSKVAIKSVNYMLDYFLQADCVYRITHIEPEMVIEINPGFINLGDIAMTYVDFHIAYPEIKASKAEVELLSAVGKNSKDVIKKYRKTGLFSDLGFGFIIMFLLYPIRSLYFRHLCKPSVLKKSILNANTLNDKAQKKNSKKIGCFTTLLIGIIFLFFMLFIVPIISVKSDKPALLASDYSTITYRGNVYIQIDDLPDDAEADTFFGATIWEDVRTDGLSGFDQVLQDDKVMLYSDKDGNKYLWLVENYTDTMLSDEEKDYDDFAEHYVYMFEASE